MHTLPDFSGELQVLCCKSCFEVVNGHWFYDKTIGSYGDANPYRGHCRNCGSRDFAVGVIPAIQAVKLSNEGFKLIPFMHDVNIPDPFVRDNIFDMGKNHVRL